MSDYIGPLTVPTRTHFAEVNGSKVTTATAMPEPVLNALAALVDALGAAFKAQDDADREADANLLRRPCQRHVGQYANYCGPCRSEQIGAALEDDEPAHIETGTEAARAAARQHLAQVLAGKGRDGETT